MRLRQSTIGNADICLRRMQYDIEKDHSVYHCGPARAIGTAYHAGLEHAYREVYEGRKWPSLMGQCEAALASLESEVEKAGENFHWTKEYPDIEAMIALVSELLSAYEPNRWLWKIHGIEQGFTLPWVDGNEKGGTMDLVLEDPNGWIVGVDHKTAKKAWPEKKSSPRVSNQASWYVGALKELYPDAPGHRFIFDIMTYGKKFERRVSDPTPMHVDLVEKKGLQVIGLYTGMRSNGMELPTNASSNLCSEDYCDFWHSCPSGSAAA